MQDKENKKDQDKVKTTKPTPPKGASSESVASKSASSKVIASKSVTSKSVPSKNISSKNKTKKTTKKLSQEITSQAKGLGKKMPPSRALKKPKSHAVSNLHPNSLTSHHINQSSKNCVSMVGDKEVEEIISKSTSAPQMQLPLLPPAKNPSKSQSVKTKDLFEKAEKQLSEVLALPVLFSSQSLDLIEKIKLFDNALSKQDVSATSPSSYVRKLEKDLHDAILSAFEQTGDIDALCEQVYASSQLYIEQKALFREAVVRLFGINASVSKMLSSKPVIVDVFGLPAFGDIASARKLLADKKSMQQMCQMLVASNSISDKSFSVAILNIPLRHDALSKPSVLHVLSSVWGAFVAQEDKVDTTTGQEILKSIVDKLKPYEVTEGTMGFVFVGVRVWKGSINEYKASHELLSHWSKSKGEEKTIARTWWQMATGRMLLGVGIPQGSLMIRPPAPPLAAQAQSLSWHITQQIYDRLGMASFDEINFVTVSENNLALRAYDHRKRLVAQSDTVPLFDVVASAEDFSMLMKEECDATGPRSFLRELSRKS